MKKPLKYIRWGIENGGMFALIYFGVNGVIGAERLFCFVIWFTAIVVFLASQIDETKKEMTKNGRTIPAWLSHGVGMAMIAYLCWHGWWFSVFAVTLNEVSKAMIFHKEEPKP